MSRLISAYLFNIMIPRGFHNYDLEEEVRRNVTSSPHPIFTYAMTPGISQCQSKMLMGYDCGNDVSPMNPKQLQEIHRRLLDDFLFVGIQEEPQATYELFLAMFGKGHLEDPSVLQRGLKSPHLLAYRRGEGGGEAEREKLRRELVKMRWEDRADEHTYEVGKRIFYKRCREYSIRTRHQ
jgi:hypothetical protein